MAQETNTPVFKGQGIALSFFVFVWVLALVLTVNELLNFVTPTFFSIEVGVLAEVSLLSLTTYLGFGTRWVLFISLLIASMVTFLLSGIHTGLADKGEGNPGVLVADFPSMITLLGAIAFLAACIFIAMHPAMNDFLTQKRAWRRAMNDPITMRDGDSPNKR